MPKFSVMLAAMALAFFANATQVRAGEDQVFGTLTGAVLGGVVGSQFGHGGGRVATTTAGVLAGGWAGNDIGYEMDNERASSASSAAPGGYHPYGADMVARQTGSDYAPNYVAPDDSPSPESVYGNMCREYFRPTVVGGQIRNSYGTACLQPDGTWLPVGP